MVPRTRNGRIRGDRPPRDAEGEEDVKRIGLFPGTFDPVTLGHLDILGRSLHLFDRMIVAVAHRHHKATLFTVEERMEMIREALAHQRRRASSR